MGSSENVLLVTFSNYGVVSVWQSLDGGNSWEPKEGNLPDIPVRWAIYHPDNDQQVMLATELGIWTTNYMVPEQVYWQQDSEGLANVRTDMLMLRHADHTVLAATHGRGLFTTTYPLDPNVSVQEQAATGGFRIYPNPSSGVVHLDLQNFGPATIRVLDISGKLVMEKQSTDPSAVQLSLGHLPKGRYVVSVLDGKTETSASLILK